MPDRMECRVAHAAVRTAQHDVLEDLIYKMFERRHHSLVAGREQDWLTVELVQSLRRESEVYREALSTKTSGPLPFALGYFRIHEGALRLTTDQVPANVEPEVLVRLLSEFVEPGATFWFGRDDEQGWRVEGVDDVVPLESE